VDWMIWAAAGGGALALIAAIFAALNFAPARTTILVDTQGSTARADMKTLWGVGPAWALRALPKEIAGNPMPAFSDPARIGYALMTPGIAEITYATLQRLLALKPATAQFKLAFNLPDAAQTRVVQTAVQAVLAAAPAPMRQAVSVSTSESLGAEVSVRFELNVAPATLKSIYARFNTTKAVREFKKRLKRKPKASKRAPREVQAS